MKRIWKLALAAALLGGFWYWANQPYRGFQSEVYLDFPRGTSTRAMARELARAGVIRYQWQFLLARALRPRTKLQAGEYLFQHPASAAAVFDRIARGDVYYHEIIVPEGSNMFDIAEIAGRSGIVSEGDFLRAAGNPGMIRDRVPEARSLEGYLFPSTYRITRRTTAEQLIRLMLAEFWKQWKLIAGEKDADLHRTVTLASLVEKETAIDSERSLVASVFVNRLAKGMKLDCDPTVIYARLLEGRYRGSIYRSDLANRHPYNTYEVAGLPPGPIANPGVASLRAALNPADTRYLFFVAKPGTNGAHQFSTGLAAHEQAVGNYRRAQRKNNKSR